MADFTSCDRCGFGPIYYNREGPDLCDRCGSMSLNDRLREYAAHKENRTTGHTMTANELLQAAIKHEALTASLREMLEIYWGEGDGHEPEPQCIQRARAALQATHD